MFVLVWRSCLIANVSSRITMSLWAPKGLVHHKKRSDIKTIMTAHVTCDEKWNHKKFKLWEKLRLAKLIDTPLLFLRSLRTEVGAKSVSWHAFNRVYSKLEIVSPIVHRQVKLFRAMMTGCLLPVNPHWHPAGSHRTIRERIKIARFGTWWHHAAKLICPKIGVAQQW